MSPRRKLSEARRTQILQAAVRVISERGLCDTRISDIAGEAGASSALVIYYFGTKGRLLAEALAFSEESFYAQTDRELSELSTAKERLVRLIELSCTVGSAGSEGWLRRMFDICIRTSAHELGFEWMGGLRPSPLQGGRGPGPAGRPEPTWLEV